MATNEAKVVLTVTGNAAGALSALNSIDATVSRIKSKLAEIGHLAVAAFSGRSLLRAADEYNQVAARIRLAAGATEDFARAQAAVFGIAQRTRADLGATAALYTRIADSLRGVGASQAEQFRFIESLNQALAVSGASGEEAASVILQLSQALGSGKLSGEEFNAVNENGRRIMQALADGLNEPIGKLREMAQAGKLTTEIVFRALQSQQGRIAQEFGALPETIGGAFTRLNNAFKQYVGQADQATGASRALSAGMSVLATNFATLGNAAIIALAAIGSVFAGRTVSAVAAHTGALARNTAEHVANTAAARGAAQQQLFSAEAVLVNAQRQAALVGGLQRLSVVQQTVIPAMRAVETAQLAVAAAGTRLTAIAGGVRAALGLLGGPIGAIVTALGLGAAAWAAWGDRAESAAERARRKLGETADAARAVLDRLQKESTFGAGDLGTLREREQQLEARISVLAQSAAGSPGAATQLEAVRDELDKVRQAIALVAQEEGKAKTAADLFREGLKDANVDAKKGAQETIKAYDNLGQALSRAMQEGVDRARELRREAANLTAEAAAVRLSGQAKADELRLLALSPEAQQSARSRAAQDAADQASSAATLAFVAAIEGRTQAAEAHAKRAAELARQAEAAAGSLEDKGRAADVIEKAAAAQAQAIEAQARNRQAQATAAEEQASRQAALLVPLEQQLDVLRKKAGEIPVSFDLTAAEAALDKLAARLPGAVAAGSPAPALAAGGLLRGPGSDTSDNLLAWLSPGEYVVRAAAVRHYGAGLLSAINSLQMPKFAAGGAVSSQTINLSWPGGGPFEVSASPQIAGQMVSLFQREALKRGRRL